MELIGRRRRAMMSRTEQEAYPYIIAKDNTTNGKTSAQQIETLLSAKGINPRGKLVLLNKVDSMSSYKMLAMQFLFGDTADQVFRYTNNDFGEINATSTSYIVNLSPGTKFIVADPEDGSLIAPSSVIADKDYSGAPQVRNFVTGNAPSEGFVLAYKSFDLSTITANSYDFIFGLIHNGAWCQGARMYHGEVRSNVPKANWDNTSYSCTIFAGDKINYIPIEILS